MDLLVEDALLGQLVIDLLLGDVLELGVPGLALIVVVLVMVVIVAVAATAASDCLRDHAL